MTSNDIKDSNCCDPVLLNISQEKDVRDPKIVRWRQYLLFFTWQQNQEL